MIGPVGTPGASAVGAAQTVKLRPSGVEVGGKLAPKASVAAEIASQGAPVDASRVAELRSAITEGRYDVDSARIADAMIASEVSDR